MYENGNRKGMGNQALCKDPQVSSHTIPQPHTIMNKLEALPDFKKFEGEQFMIAELFRNPESTQCLCWNSKSPSLASQNIKTKPVLYNFKTQHLPPCTTSNTSMPVQPRWVKIFQERSISRGTIWTVCCKHYSPMSLPPLPGKIETMHPTRCLAAELCTLHTQRKTLW